jgi:hypothetical protein
MSFLDNLAEEISNSMENVEDKNTLFCIKVAVLSAYAGMLGNLFKIYLNDKYCVFPNLYSMIVGKSGVGKSGYYSSLVQIFKEEFKKSLEQSDKIKRIQAASLMNVIEQELSGKTKKVKKEEFEKRMKEQATPDGAFFATPSFFVDDFTEAALFYDAGNKNFGNFSVYDDELNNIFDDFINNRQAKKKLNIFLKGYECKSGDYQLVRRDQTNNQKPVYDFCLNLMGTVQPTTLRNYINSYIKEKLGHGLFGRFQAVGFLGDNFTEQKKKQNVNSSEKKFKEICAIILNKIQSIQKDIYERLDVNGNFIGFSRYKILFSAEAAELLKEERRRNEKRARTCENIILEEFLNKKTTGVAKLAALIRLVRAEEKLFSGVDNHRIEVEDIEEAIKLSDFSMNNLAFLVGEGDELTPEVRNCEERLIKYMTDKSKVFYKKFKDVGFTMTSLKSQAARVLPKDNYDRFDDIAISQIIVSLLDKKIIIAIEEKQKFKNIVKFFLNDSSKEINNMPTLNVDEAIELLNNNAYRHKYKVTDNYDHQFFEMKLVEEQPRVNLDKVNDSIKFESLVKKYVRDYKNSRTLCKCIFHDDSTASLSIDVENKRFNCFGCGAKGDAIEFLQLVEKKTFNEVINEQSKLLTVAKTYEGKKEEPPLVEKVRISIGEKAYMDRIINGCKANYAPLVKYFGSRLHIDEFNKKYGNFLKSFNSFDNEFFKKSDLLFHKHLNLNDNGQLYNGIVALVKEQFSGEVRGIHRLYLQNDGEDLIKKDGKRVKRLYKCVSSLLGGSIKVFTGETNNYAILCEGIETGIAIAYYRQFDTTIIPAEFRHANVYSGMTASHMPYANLKEKNILIVGDAGGAGEEAVYNAQGNFINAGKIVKSIISKNSDVLDDYIEGLRI